jgi:hypothetical protein
MKKLLFALIAVPFYCSAQQFEIGLDGGFAFHTLPMSNTIAKQDKPILGYAAGANIDLLLPHAQIGIGVSAAELSETNYLAPNYTIKVYDRIAHPLITPYAFYNYLWDQGSDYVYAGGMAGLAVASVGVNTFDQTGPAVSGYTTAYNSTYGFVVGIQAGFIVRAGKHIGIGGQAAMRYTDYTYTPPSNPGENPYVYRLFYFPFTVSLRYFI